MRITVLGSGDAFGSGGRRQSSYLVETSTATFLLDAGATVLAGMRDARVSTDRLDFVALSHLHGDHFSGLPFLYLEYLYEFPRERELVVAGPRGTETRVGELMRAMYKETASCGLAFPVRYLEHVAGEVQEISGVRIRPIAVPHQRSEPSFALLVEADGERLLYSGDSAWTEEFVEVTQGVDFFLCECTYWTDVAPVHMNYQELRRRLPELGASRVVLSHLGRQVLEHLDEIDVECATDGAQFEVRPRER